MNSKVKLRRVAASFFPWRSSIKIRDLTNNSNTFEKSLPHIMPLLSSTQSIQKRWNKVFSQLQILILANCKLKHLHRISHLTVVEEHNEVHDLYDQYILLSDFPHTNYRGFQFSLCLRAHLTTS